MKALIAFLLLAWPAQAQEFVAVDGRLSDADFYRLVACAAPPGGPCSKPFIRWPQDRRDPLRVGFVRWPEGVHPVLANTLQEALDNAIFQINGVQAGMRLERTDGLRPDIEIHVVATAPGSVMTGTGHDMLDGALLPLARVALRAQAGEITQAVIAVSKDVDRRAAASVMLEELVQALGLVTDVLSPAYPRSVFAEDSNFGVRLVGQDAMVLLRHYPPN